MSQAAKQAKIEKDRVKIINYRQLLDDIFKLRDNNDHSRQAFEQTTKILTKNPEFYTGWNFRREIMLDLFTDNLDDNQTLLTEDLLLVLSLLKRYPKCYWIWNHRRWCLFELVAINRVDWKYEFAIVNKLLELDPRNFHGWQYRRFVVENIENSVKPINNDDVSSQSLALLDINVKEFDYTTSKINSNLSNFSAWHNRSKLIPKIYQLFQNLNNNIPENHISTYEVFKRPYTILVHELELIKTGMYMDPEDTSIWLYLYWLLTNSFFVDDLINNSSEQTYMDLLNEQLQVVEELNELEKEDHIYKQDNCWCLKTIVFLKCLIIKCKTKSTNPKDLLSDETKRHLQTLIEIDSLRKGRYLDQLSGKANLLPT